MFARPGGIWEATAALWWRKTGHFTAETCLNVSNESRCVHRSGNARSEGFRYAARWGQRTNRRQPLPPRSPNDTKRSTLLAGSKQRNQHPKGPRCAS